MDVLVLDQTWQPSRIIDAKRAVLLLLSGKAIPVTDVAVATMRSPSVSIDVPAVIQVSTLIRFGVRKTTAPEVSRKRIMVRDNYECQFVVDGRPCTTIAETIDHVIPRSRGGQDTWQNLVAACLKHNSVKADRTFEEMQRDRHWALKREPVAPRLMIKSFARAKTIHPEWEVFLAAG